MKQDSKSEVPKKSALITGISGQDGAYLAAQLLDQGYRVVGLHQPSRRNLWRLSYLGIREHLNLELREHELKNTKSNKHLIEELQIDECYNLAAVSSLAEARQAPLLTSQINGIAPISLLEAIRDTSKHTRFFQASSAEIFGTNKSLPQTENTPLSPSEPYAFSKAHAHRMVQFYRENFGVFACCGILYNHESPLRGNAFVTKKIAQGLVSVVNRHHTLIEVGNLDAQRDWGYAGDYTIAMHSMLQHTHADSYILSTGKLHTVREFIAMVCKALDIEIEWRGEDMDEVGINRADGSVIVKVNPGYYRREPKKYATGSAGKAATEFGWTATTNLTDLCKMMVDFELDRSDVSTE